MLQHYCRMHNTTTRQCGTLKLQLTDIKNYLCHNYKVKYFTANEKTTIYNIIHFFLFFLLGFLPFLSFCNKTRQPILVILQLNAYFSHNNIKSFLLLAPYLILSILQKHRHHHNHHHQQH